MRQRLMNLAMVFCMFTISSCDKVDSIDSNGWVEGETNLLSDSSFVSVEKAVETANSFMNMQSGRKNTRTGNSSFKINTIFEKGEPLMYVLNYSDGGFVIVSATKEFYPILAYSEDNNFDMSSSLSGVEKWLNDTKEAIFASESINDSVKAKISFLWNSLETSNVPIGQTKASTRGGLSNAEIACYMRCEDLLNQYGYGGDDSWHFCPLSDAQQTFENAGYSSVYQNLCYSAEFNHSTPSTSVLGWKICTIKKKEGPFISTKWHQNTPFNDLCDGCPAGCAAIALAQILKYYQYPKHFSYNGHTFGWSTIPTYPDPNSDQAAFIHIVGNHLNTSYHSSYSYVTPGNMEDGIANIGYNVTVRDHNTHSVEQEVMYAKRPVIMLGNEDNLSFLPGSLKYMGSSHYWVCDGAESMTCNKLLLFTEWQPYGNGNFVQGWNSIDNPYDFGGVTYLNLHMNWGWGGNCNGWFGDYTNSGSSKNYDNPNLNNSGGGNFEYSVKDFFISR